VVVPRPLCVGACPGYVEDAPSPYLALLTAGGFASVPKPRREGAFHELDTDGGG
jgi:hypothetical protein